MSKSVGKSVTRVDAYEKATGRAKYTADLCDRSALVARILHSTIAHGYVKSIDTAAAEAIPGVVKVLTCFDAPNYPFPTAGHPWSTDPAHQDVADRLLLNRHVRYYGDDIAAVIAEDEVAAAQAVRALKVEYEELPFVLDAQKAMEPDAPQIHEDCPGNVLKHTDIRRGDYQQAIQEPGLIKVEGWYDTPTVQHCHIENHGCFAYEEAGRVVVVTSTQIPHIIRRVVGQALGLPWGKVRIIKPYIGGGFGNKQDALYEPLCAWLSTQVGGRLVHLECSREETFVSNRVRHAIRTHIISWVRPDGTLAARKFEAWSNQGGYASHGHSIVAKGMGAFPQLYPCDNLECDCWTVYTNRPAAGAMRGYGIPQAMWAGECHIDDICKAIGMEPMEFRRKNLMPVGYTDGFSKNELYSDTFNQCMDKGMALLDYARKYREYQNQTGPIRKGVGLAVFWYNTAVWPISLESSSCRMVLNQDGSLQFQTGETEIGQGCDTAYSQMVADAVGIPVEDVHAVSTQDTDVTPFGTGAYASRQTYIGGFSIMQTAQALRERILQIAHEQTRMPVSSPGPGGREHRPQVRRPGPQDPGRAGHGEPLLPGAQPAHHGGDHGPDQVQRLLLRLLLCRGGGGHPHVQGEAAEHRQRPRLRHPHQPRPGGGPGPRRHVHGHRLRPLRGAEVRREDRKAPEQQPAGLQAVHLYGPSHAPGGVRGEPGAHVSLRHQGPGRAAGLLAGAGHPQRHPQRHRRGL